MASDGQHQIESQHQQKKKVAEDIESVWTFFFLTIFIEYKMETCQTESNYAYYSKGKRQKKYS